MCDLRESPSKQLVHSTVPVKLRHFEGMGIRTPGKTDFFLFWECTELGASQKLKLAKTVNENSLLDKLSSGTGR